MNYRHAFHAGNFADVAKHVTLVALLGELAQRPRPLTYIESHAGAGLYNLRGAEAKRSGEAVAGIATLWRHAADHSLPSALAEYLRLLGELNNSAPGRGELARYPGSPWLAQAILRPADKLFCCEYDEATAAALQQALGTDKRISVQQRDGYQALQALVPPRIRRGLLLMDPPYEAADEFRRAGEAFIQACRRWPAGVVALWYPLKSPAAMAGLYRSLSDSGLRKLLLTECRQVPPDHPPGLHGGGIIIANPPWQAPAGILAALQAVAALLAPGLGAARVEWLVPE